MKILLSLRSLTGRAAEEFCRYGAFTPTPLSLGQLSFFGKKACQEKSYTFLRNEIPVRLANIMQEIHLLPETLLEMPSVKMVIGWYEQSFRELVPFDDQTMPDARTLDNFTDTLDKIRNRHKDVVMTMAEGILELKERYGYDLNTDSQLQYFLDRFYLSRISIRMLINHHVLLFGLQQSTDEHLGAIDPNTNLKAILWDAYGDARFLCEQYYLSAPEMKLSFVQANGLEQDELHLQQPLVYVPSHLHHMCFELLKNAMRATLEHSMSLPQTGQDEDQPLPPIHVLISSCKEDVTIKVSDLGGGIARSHMDMVFKYTYTTATSGSGCTAQHMSGGSAPLAGYGYGLPLSRLYARYFNGDLSLSSVEGYGTDAYIFLKRHAADADELLPVFNQTSARQYQGAVPIGDWSDPSRTTGLHAYRSPSDSSSSSVKVK